MVLQIVGILFKSREFGVEVIDDVFGVEGSERWQVIFFVIVGGSHRRGAGGSESIGIFHSCFLYFVSRVMISFLDEMVFSFISLQSGGGMSQVSFGFPGIVTGGISLPFDEVNIASSLSLVRDYRFHFVFVFSFDKIRWRTRVIGSMDVVFMIWR